MYLHFIDDISQINHHILRTNEMYPGEHRFFILTKSGKWQNVVKESNVSAFNPDLKNIKEIAGKLTGYKAVFLHNLCYKKALIVFYAPKDTLFVWGIWGFDYYYIFPQLFRTIFLPWTKLANLFLFKYSLMTKDILSSIHPVSKYLGIKSTNRIRRQVIPRIRYSFNNMPMHSEVYRVIDSPPNTRFDLSYYSIESITRGIEGSDFDRGAGIYIGNSATNSSNHIDLFLQLRKISLINRKIIVSLSYGCPRYRRLVIAAGRFFFGSNFIALSEYLSLKEYNSVLLGCSSMFFNHKRAQALGNIIFGIWAGHKIFLRQKNPVYNYLKSLGITVFSIENELNSAGLGRLEVTLQKKNREIITRHYSEEKIRENYAELIRTINEKAGS